MVLIYDNNQRLLIVKSETLESSFSFQHPCYDRFISTETFLAISNISSPLREDSFFLWAHSRKGMEATHHRTRITCLPPIPLFPILNDIGSTARPISLCRVSEIKVSHGYSLLHASTCSCDIYIYIYTYIYMQAVCAKSLQSCLTLCDPMDCSPPGSSVHGILQARTQNWVAMPSSRESSIYKTEREREREKNTRIQWMDPGQIQSLTYKWSPECLLTPHLPLSPGCSAFQLRWKFLRKSLDAFLEHGDLAGLWKTIFWAPNMGYISKLLVHSLFISKLGMTCVLLTFLLRKNAPVFIIYLINLWAIKK